jgi:hypothetical protein
MTAIIISATIGIGLAAALIPYIPKEWIERHIVMEIDPNDPDF